MHERPISKRGESRLVLFLHVVKVPSKPTLELATRVPLSLRVLLVRLRWGDAAFLQQDLDAAKKPRFIFSVRHDQGAWQRSGCFLPPYQELRRFLLRAVIVSIEEN